MDLETTYNNLMAGEPVEKIFDILEFRRETREQNREGVVRC